MKTFTEIWNQQYENGKIANDSFYYKTKVIDQILRKLKYYLSISGGKDIETIIGHLQCMEDEINGKYKPDNSLVDVERVIVHHDELKKKKFSKNRKNHE